MGGITVKQKMLVCIFVFACLFLSPACFRQRTEENSQSDAQAYSVRCIELTTENIPIKLFCEIPELNGLSFGDTRINSFFSMMLRNIAASEWELISGAVAEEPIQASSLRDCRTAEVTLCTDSLFSAAMQYDRYLGGVRDCGIDGYTFDRESGERLFLRDVIACGEEAVRKAVAAGLLAQYPEVSEIKDASGKTPLDAIKSKTFDSFDFYLTESGTIVVVFDKYEIAPALRACSPSSWTPAAPKACRTSEKRPNCSLPCKRAEQTKNHGGMDHLRPCRRDFVISYFRNAVRSSAYRRKAAAPSGV